MEGFIDLLKQHYSIKYTIQSWWYMVDICGEADGEVLGRIQHTFNPPVREVEVNPTKEWDKEEGEDEEGNVART